jgi:histone H3/H4
MRLNGDMNALTVDVAETKTVGDLKRAYEKVYGVAASCQIIVSMAAEKEEGEEEKEEGGDAAGVRGCAEERAERGAESQRSEVEENSFKEAALFDGLSNELSLEAACIVDGSTLSLSVKNWMVEVGGVLSSGVWGVECTISNTQSGSAEATLEAIEERQRKVEEARLEVRAREERTAVTTHEDGMCWWSPRQEPASPEKRTAWADAVVRALEQLTGSHADELVFDRAAFEQVVRQVGVEIKTDVFWDEQAVTALQLCVESYLKKLLHRGKNLADLVCSTTATSPLGTELHNCEMMALGFPTADVSAFSRENVKGEEGETRAARKYVAPKDVALAVWLLNDRAVARVVAE